MRVVARELERCARQWEEAADEVESLLRVLRSLEPAALRLDGEAAQAAGEFVAAVRWWVEHLVALARARAGALEAYVAEVVGTEHSVALRLGGGGASW